MSLAESIEKYRFESTYQCPWVKMYNKLTNEDQEAINKALANNYATTTIITALRQEGYRIGEPSLNHHRQGKCRCLTAK